MKALFIGGFHDGKRWDVPDEVAENYSPVQLAKKADGYAPAEVETYYRMAVSRYLDVPVAVYAISTITPRDAIEALITRYPNPMPINSR